MITGLSHDSAALLIDFCNDQRRSLERPFSEYLNAGSPHQILTLQARRENQGPQRTVHQALRQHRHLVLLGEAGAGKTTTLRELHRRALERFPASPHPAQALIEDGPDLQIPFTITLNLYTHQAENRWIFDHIMDQLRYRLGHRDLRHIVACLLEEGRCLLLLDGLNEVSDVRREEALQDIRQILIRYPRTRLVISCREQLYYQFFSLPIWHLQPLSDEQVRDYWTTFSAQGPPGQRLAYDQLDPAVTHLCRTPMLLVMIAHLTGSTTTRTQWTIGSLYRDFIQLWFERERARDTAGHPEDLWLLEEALTRIGWFLQERGETCLTTEALVIRLGRMVQELESERAIPTGVHTGQNICNRLWQYGLLDHTGTQSRFHHHTFQIHFAARHLQRLLQTDILRLAGQPHWVDVLSHFYGFSQNVADFTQIFLQRGDVIEAARCAVSGQGDDATQRDQVIDELIKQLTDRYRFHSQLALQYLRQFTTITVERRIQAALSAAGTSQGQQRLQQALATVSSTQTDQPVKAPEPVRLVAEPTAMYGGETHSPDAIITGTAEPVAILAAIDAVDPDTVKPPQVRHWEAHIRQSAGMPDHAWWFLYLVTHVRGQLWYDGFLERDLRWLLHTSVVREDCGSDRDWIIANTLLDPQLPDVLRRRLTQEAFDADRPRHWLPVVQDHLFPPDGDGNTDGLSQFRIILEGLWRIAPMEAEDWATTLLQDRDPTHPLWPACCDVLRQQALTDQSARRVVSWLQGEYPSDIRITLIDAIARGGCDVYEAPLLRIALHAGESPALRAAALTGLSMLGTSLSVNTLTDLAGDDNPVIFDAAYEALQIISERLRTQERIRTLRESIREGPPPVPGGAPMIPAAGVDPKIRIWKHQPESVEINGVSIALGPVAGTLLTILAEHGPHGQLCSSAHLAAALTERGLACGKNTIKNRIADIRRRIAAAHLPGINVYILVENIPRSGYRLNAGIDWHNDSGRA